MKKIKVNDINDDLAMSVLELFISQLVEIMSKNGDDSNPMDVCIEIRECIDSWVKANNLHPEGVKHFKTKDDLIKHLIEL